MPVRFQPLVVYLRQARDSRLEQRKGFSRASDQLIQAKRHAADNNGHIVADHREATPRPPAGRPALRAAINRAKGAHAWLLFPHFAHIARDAEALRLLWESELEFIALDNQHANRITLPLLASVVIAEYEATSQRVRKSLTRLRRKGVRLGAPSNLTEEARRRGSLAVKKRARDQAATPMGEQMATLRNEGRSLREIAAILTAEGRRAPKGGRLTHTHVRRMLARYDEVIRSREEYRIANPKNRPHSGHHGE